MSHLHLIWDTLVVIGQTRYIIEVDNLNIDIKW